MGEQSKVRHDGRSCVTTERKQTESQRTNFPSVMTDGYVRRDGRPLEIGFWLLFDGLILDLNLEKFDDLN